MVNISKLVLMVGNLISITNAGLLHLLLHMRWCLQISGEEEERHKMSVLIEPCISEVPVKLGKIFIEGR